MKRFLLLLLALLLVFGQACAAGEDPTARIDRAALESYAEQWNGFFAEGGTPVTLSVEEVDGSIMLLCAYAAGGEPQAVTVQQLFAEPETAGSLSLAYYSSDDLIMMPLFSEYLLDQPRSLEMYAGSGSWSVTVEKYTTDGIEDYLLSFPYEAVEACLREKNGFLRIETDRGTCFQELGEAEAPLVCTMLAKLYEGVCYSHRQRGAYLSPELLPAAAAAGSAPAASGIAFQNDYEAIDRAARSVFLLEAYDEKDTCLSLGSGFLAFDSQTLITNHHVIDGAAYLIAYSDNYEAAYLLTDLKAVHEERDIAILRFESEGKTIPPLPLDSKTKLLRGQPVTAIGSPQGVLNTVSGGNISNITNLSAALPDAIQFTAAISPGSSGGALFGENGSVIGLVFSKLSAGENMNFAVPIKYVEELYRESGGGEVVPLAKYNRLAGQLEPLTLQTPTLLEGGIQLVWSAVKEAEEYRVYRMAGNGGGEELITATTANSCIDTGAVIGQSYIYRVEAVHSWKNSSYSNRQSILAATPTPVPTPSPTPTLAPTPTPAPTPVPQGKVLLKNGDSGEEVLSLKLKLFELGYLAESGLEHQRYDQILTSAVQEFQRNHGLTATGVLDDTTLAVLDGGKAVPGTYTVAEELLSLGRRHYKEGDTGSDVKKLKARLLSLGYYRPDASYGDDYNSTMTERVKQLQKNNGLAVTGVLDHRTLAKLYAADCVKGKWYVKPTPAPLPAKELGVKLVIPDNAYGEWDYLDGDLLKFRLQVKNTSSVRTISSYEIYLYPETYWGNRLIGKNEVYVIRETAEIGPGKTVYTPYIRMSDAAGIATVYAAVHKVSYTDGTSSTVLFEDYSSWTLD